MFERFQASARQVVVYAQQEAKELKHNYIGTGHLLLGLLCEGEGAGFRVLEHFGMTAEAVREGLKRHIEPNPSSSGEIPFTPAAKRVLELSLREALSLGHNYIGTEHILLGLTKEPDGVVAKIFEELGVDVEKIRPTVLEFINPPAPKKETAAAGVGGKSGSEAKKGSKLLDQYGRNLTQLAAEGKLDPVVGRETEIERIMQILVRRTKNNPVLVGEPGVGKTAVVEGLAARIANQEVPELLADKHLYTLDLALLVAGTKFRGEFEERIKKLVKEITDRGDIILFIDEIHTMIGAGAAEGALDAASILKPAMARGEIHIIGATTLDEYRKYIEKDAALERRFQQVRIEPPNVDETVQILKGLRDRYEEHHKVTISDEALQAAADLADRYISDRFLPDKAIDVVDEAASRLRIKTFTARPRDLQLEAEIEKTKQAKDEAISKQQFEQAAELRNKLRELEERRRQLEAQAAEREERPVVDEEAVADIVSMWTGIPVFKVTESETRKLLRLEEELHERLIGQDEAVSAVAKAIRRSRAGLADPNRPTGSFLFLGPTGVGKTELARTLAANLFGDEQAMVRIDMSEYMEKHTVSRLVGAPPGYVGHEEGGQLTEAVRRRPYSVVLLDEIEKAHQDVFNILLQILEDGHLTDSQGRKVDFRNTIVIMTSNLGASEITSSGKLGFRVADEEDGQSADDYKDMKARIMGQLRKTFRPELLNRIDEVIIFRKLTRDQVKQIADLLLERLRKQLGERQVSLELTEEAKDLLVDRGYDPDMGARPLRRVIQKYVEDPLAEAVIAAEPAPGSVVVVERNHQDDEDEPLRITVKPPAQDADEKQAENGAETVPAG